MTAKPRIPNIINAEPVNQTNRFAVRPLHDMKSAPQ